MTNKSNLLPETFLQRLQKILPASSYAAAIRSFSEKPTLAFRVNTLLDSSNEIEFMATPVPWYPNAYTTQMDKSVLTDSTAFKTGKIYIQNLSSMAAVFVLDPQPGEEVLDLTAAPGSKTTQIACHMENQGRIAAVEKSRNRFFKLKHNLEKHGVCCADLYHKDGRLIFKHCRERFDRILLDAPCSSEARFHTDEPETFAYWSEKKIQEMARNQWSLLSSAFLCLKPGGTLVYSTCSFAPEENEANIARLIKKYGDQVLLKNIDLPIENIQPGLTTWNGKTYPHEVSRCIRILPTNHMSGFFICLAKKQATP